MNTRFHDMALHQLNTVDTLALRLLLPKHIWDATPQVPALWRMTGEARTIKQYVNHKYLLLEVPVPRGDGG